ncbi:MAG TPA: hypothetical protein VIL60_07520 [Rhodanobacter sp.]
MLKLVSIIAMALCACGASGVLLAQDAPTPTAPAAATSVPSAASRSASAVDPHCVRYTGSRIRSATRCLPGAGRSYGQQDLQSTGEVGVGSALNRLDPAITIHRD